MPLLEVLELAAATPVWSPGSATGADLAAADGVHAARFIRYVLEQAARAPSGRGDPPDPDAPLMTLCGRLGEATDTTSGPFLIDRAARFLGRDLGDRGVPVAHDLLELGAAHTPAVVGELIRGLAAYGSPRLQQAALHFSVSSDELIDRWLAGIDPAVLERNFGPVRPSLLQPLPGGQPVLGALLLGLLRARGRSPVLDRLVVDLRRRVSPILDAAAAVCLGEVERDAVLRRHGADALWMAQRAGWRMRLDAAWIGSLALDGPGWPLLFASAPRGEWLSALAALDAPRRAVVGLIAPGEDRALSADELLHAQIREARGGRPLAIVCPNEGGTTP